MLRPQSLLQSQQHKHSEPENDSVLELHEVEAIVSARYNAEKSTFEYETKWVSLPPSQNTWKSTASLNGAQIGLIGYWENRSLQYKLAKKRQINKTQLRLLNQCNKIKIVM